jgi:DNA-binding NarL/FixJ family response regulator
MEGIEVGVFDEHEIFRFGAASILQDDPMVSVITHDISSAGTVDVAVTSIGFIDHSGIACPIVACASPNEVIPMSSDRDNVVALLLRDEVTPDQLRGAVHAAAAGLRIHWEPVTVGLLDERSRAVLTLLASGAGTREISSELGYSERTIKGTIQQLEQTLGARSRAHAVAVAMRSALI